MESYLITIFVRQVAGTKSWIGGGTLPCLESREQVYHHDKAKSSISPSEKKQKKRETTTVSTKKQNLSIPKGVLHDFMWYLIHTHKLVSVFFLFDNLGTSKPFCSRNSAMLASLAHNPPPFPEDFSSGVIGDGRSPWVHRESSWAPRPWKSTLSLPISIGLEEDFPLVMWTLIFSFHVGFWGATRGVKIPHQAQKKQFWPRQRAID